MNKRNRVGMVNKVFDNIIIGSSRQNSDKGFTLVELIVVLVVLAIMAAAVIPGLMGYTDYAKDKKYIETADECLKASQSVITDAYSDASNYVTKAERYSAAGMAKVSTDDTTFCVWTGKKLIPGDASDSTKATSDNVGAYTIVYALYGTGTGDDDKHLFYDGNEWTVYDTKKEAWDAADDLGLTNSDTTSNYLAMWQYEDDWTTIAHEDTTETWLDEEEDVQTIPVTFHLTGNTRPHGTYFSNASEEDKYKDFTIEFVVNSNREVTCDACPDNSLTDGSTVNVDGTALTLGLEYGFSNLCWNNEDSSNAKSYYWTSDNTDSDTDLRSAIASGINEFWAYNVKDPVYTTVKFNIYNLQTLKFAEDTGVPSVKIKEVTFTSFKNKYDYGKPDANSENIKNISIPVTSSVDSTYTFRSWAYYNKGKNEYELLMNGLTNDYISKEKIWEKVFDKEKDYDSAYSPEFTAVAQTGRTVTLVADEHSSFEDFDGDEQTLEALYIELIDKTIDTFDTYQNHRITPDEKYRFKGWSETKWVDGEDGELAFYSDNIVAIKDRALLGSQSEITLYAVTKPISGAKIIGGASETSNNYATSSVINSLADGKANITAFERADYRECVGDLGDIFKTYVTNDDDGQTVNLASGKVVSGNNDGIFKFGVLYDGSDPKYPVPVFAYSVAYGDGYKVIWFSEEKSPEVQGGLYQLFDGCNNCDFTKSGLSDWDYTGCISTSQMFKKCEKLKSGDIVFRSWNLSSVRTIANMFDGCNNTAFTSIDFSDVDLASITSMANWVIGCNNLESINFDNVNSPNLKTIATYTSNRAGLKYFTGRNWQAQQVADLKTMFQNCTILETVNLSGANFESVTSLESAFSGAIKNPDGVNKVDFSNANLCNVTTAKDMFLGSTVEGDYNYIKSISFEGADLSKLENVYQMFMHQTVLTDLNLNTIGKFYPTTCFKMFDQCWSLEHIVGLDQMDTRNTTNMQNMFYRCESMKDGSILEKLDFSSVTTMEKMFAGAAFEKIDLSGTESQHRVFNELINVKNIFGVKNVDDEFYRAAKATEIDFRYCEMPKLTDMQNMFQNPSTLSEDKRLTRVDLTGSDFSSVTGGYANLFNGCTNLQEICLDNCDMSGITGSIQNNFLANCSSLNTFSAKGWNISGCSNTYTMFSGSSVVNVYFDNCNMSDAKNVEKMFMNTENLSIASFENWYIPNVTSMKSMFEGSGISNVSFDSCVMTSVESLYGLFKNCESLAKIDMSGWIIPSVTSMESMFENSGIQTVTVNTTNEEGAEVKAVWTSLNTMKNMFKGCASLTSISLGDWDVDSVTNVESMFASSGLTSANFDNCDMSAVTNIKDIFSGCTGLTSITLNKCNMSGITGAIGGDFIKNCSSLSTFSAVEWNISNCSNTNSLFDGSTVSTVDLTDCNMSMATQVNYMFSNTSNLRTITLTGWNIPRVQHMKYMFSGSGITGVSFKGVIANSVLDMQYMFNNCKNLSGMTLTEWVMFKKSTITENASTVTTINNMFNNSSVTMANFNNCDMSAVTNINGIFNGCTSLLSFTGEEWNLSDVKSNYNLFKGCTGLASVTLDKCDMSGITGGINNAFFENCNALTTVKADEWNINNCNSLSNLFGKRTNLKTVNMNGIKIDKVNKNNGGFQSMFSGCTNLESVKMNVTSTGMGKQQQKLNSMFDGCISLTTVDFENVDISRIEQIQYIFNNCTSYTVSDLQETFSRIDLSTDTNKLFCNHKTGDGGWNTLFKSNSYNSSFINGGTKNRITTATTTADALYPELIGQGVRTYELEIGGGDTARNRRLCYYLEPDSTHKD